MVEAWRSDPPEGVCERLWQIIVEAMAQKNREPCSTVAARLRRNVIERRARAKAREKARR